MLGGGCDGPVVRVVVGLVVNEVLVVVAVVEPPRRRNVLAGAVLPGISCPWMAEAVVQETRE